MKSTNEGSMPEPNSVWIVIPVLNGWRETEQCLRALEPGLTRDFTIAVVDHGSTDETKRELPRLFPEVVHLQETDRLWWTGATNVGVRHALAMGAEYIVPLNNDCFLEAESVRRLVALAERRRSIVAPVQRERRTRVVRAATARPALAFGFLTISIATEIPPGAPELIETGLIMGGRGSVIPRQVFEEIGLFAEDDLPHYHADSDFYLRCRRAGIPLYIARDVDVLVDETRTSIAAQPREDVDWEAFRRSLRDPRSHRNVPSLAAFFRRNYPIPRLWWIGAGLYLARTTALWVVARARAIARLRSHQSTPGGSNA